MDKNSVLKITLCQIATESDYEKLKAVLEKCFEKSHAVGGELVVFPELFNTPFLIDDMRASADQSAKILNWIKKLCRRYKLYCVAGSLAWKENDNIYNRSYIIGPDGQSLGFFDKIHLLQVHSRHDFDESEVFNRGDHLYSFSLGSWRIGIVICYDIRFPELTRLYGEDIDLLIVPAAFNEAVGKKHWKSLLQTRAIENQFYVIGINPAFQDYGSYRSYAQSLVIDPDGKILLEMGKDPETATLSLNLEEVSKIRKRSPYYTIRSELLYEKLKKEKR